MLACGNTCKPTQSFTTIMKSRPPPTVQTVKVQTSTDRLASDKNRRLAQQMERRPAVEAALGVKKTAARAPSPPKLSVRERLGPKRGFTSPQGVGLTRGGLNRGRGNAFNRGRGMVRGKPLTSPISGRITKTTRGNFNKPRGRGGFRGGRGKGFSRGRGGVGAKVGTKEVSKDALDSDLDSYMSKTKGHMDAELDEYMANQG
uniref:Chromatin target of PRMT1 protein C-terminal domain-containing protein n=1 Tax=Ciona savignyi TaxID=51511 RepID=H2ZCY0_CIOSA